MRKIYLIGIGPGGYEYLTIQAIEAMKKTDIFFLLEKQGKGREELTQIRKEILERYLAKNRYSVVSVIIPERKRTIDYPQGVEAWRREKAKIINELIRNDLKENQTGAFLIWGDPCLYDGTLEILQNILKQGKIEFDYEVIPGITSIQTLTAKHKIPLNHIGESILITTGRGLKSTGLVENTVVLLDFHSALKGLKKEGIDIYWGGYLGTKDEILVTGKLSDVIKDIKEITTHAKKKKKWLMSTYLLRKVKDSER